MQLNRHQKRAAVSPKVSTELLRQRISALESENQVYRDLLFAIIKEAGRVRVAKATIQSLQQGDSMNPRDLGDAFMLEFSQGDMVVRGGVKDGKPGAA